MFNCVENNNYLGAKEVRSESTARKTTDGGMGLCDEGNYAFCFTIIVIVVVW